MCDSFWQFHILITLLLDLWLHEGGEGGRKKGVTHGPGYAGNGGIMRVSRPGWPPLVIPPLTNSFFFILKVISPSRSFIDLSIASESASFSFFHQQDLTAVRILVGSHGLGGRCESSLFCLSKLWLNLVTTLDTFFEYIQFSVVLQCQHIVISLKSNWQSHDLFTHSCFVATSSTNGVEEASS